MTTKTNWALMAALTTTPFWAHAHGVDMTHHTAPSAYTAYEREIIEMPRTEVDVQEAVRVQDGRVEEVDEQVEVVEYGENDPIEGFNRVIFEINDFFDGLLFTPISKIYQGVFPGEVRMRIHYVLRNLREPVTFANNLLQGDFSDAGMTLGRFVTNSTVGVAGVFDVGADWGMPFERHDFGMTLASWGVGEGGYFMLPILGPSTFRDAPSEVVDVGLDPATWVFPASMVHYHYIRAGAQGVDDYSDVQSILEDLRKNSIDYYASLRSWYLERRRATVRKGLDRPYEPQESPVPFDEEPS